MINLSEDTLKLLDEVGYKYWKSSRSYVIQTILNRTLPNLISEYEFVVTKLKTDNIDFNDLPKREPEKIVEEMQKIYSEKTKAPRDEAIQRLEKLLHKLKSEASKPNKKGS